MRASAVIGLVGVVVLATSCSGGQSSGQGEARQVTAPVACADAKAYTELALTIVFSGKDVWDSARSKGDQLLAEQTSDEDVNAALQDIAHSGIDLANATEDLAADPAVKAALAKGDAAAAAPLAQQIEAVTTAGDRVSDTC